jgi:4-amino-4-deoxy-L-arabinose transferase-like glycosyltransferase
LDWWNAQTVYEFLDKWCLIINMVGDQFIPNVNYRVKHVVHVLVLQVIMLMVFGQSLSLLACVLFAFVLIVVYFLGGVKGIQNNMIVHVLCMSYTPILIALEVKNNIFSKGFFD